MTENINTLEGSQSPKRVLLVEDYPALAQMTTWALEMHGHQVVLATDGLTALQIAKESPPDLIIMDIGIAGGMDGYATCSAMRKEPNLRDTIIVAQTGWGQEEHRRRSKEAGFNQHLVKPVDIDVLINLVNSVKATDKESVA